MKRVGIIGLGRFGIFWAKVLSHGYDVCGYSRSKKEGLCFEQVSLEEICSLPVIFLCSPMSTLPSVLKQIQPLIRKDAIIIDTCSVKMEPVRWMKEILPKDVSIIATHPMFGPESGKVSLENLPIMMHPVRVPAEMYSEWKTYFFSLGMSVVEMTVEEHDKQAALSQALTHMIGRTLNFMKIQETPIGTTWYRNLYAISKQVAKDSPELFLDMQTLNPFAVSMREDFMSSWNEVCNEISEGRFSIDR